MSYTKLSHSILTSTLWMEDAHTRLVWVTMLAMKDRHGEVMGSIPGLANVARVPVEACRAAIAKFLAPDPDSRTTDHEGRRIEAIQGGWLVLNHAAYRDMDSDEDRRRKDAVRQQRVRDRRKESSRRDGVTNSTSSAIQISDADAKSDADANAREKARTDELDICNATVTPSNAATDSDHWQMHERNQPWAKSLKAASCKIGRDNWTAWKALVDSHSLPVVLSAAKGVPATERWPDRTEQTLQNSRGQENPGDVIASRVKRITL